MTKSYNDLVDILLFKVDSIIDRIRKMTNNKGVFIADTTLEKLA